MMTVRFIPLAQEETRKWHPQYVRDDITCFEILKNQIPVGLYGLIDHGIDPLTKAHQGEGFLTIFPAFRYRTLSKGFFLALFDHAFDSGFGKVYTWTRLSSWQKVLGRFTSLGIHRLETPPLWDLDLDPTKIWFVKETRKEF